MSFSNRRSFMKQAAGAAALTLTRSAWAKPGDKIVLGGIGCGKQGSSLIRLFAGMDGVDVAYVCDPDDERAAQAAREVTSIRGASPRVVKDFREILDDRSVDAVTVATPDHWHAPAAILACAAGKHVYVEKPCSHNLREGRLLVEAAVQHRRIVQHGTQSRSNDFIMHAIQKLREGIIGDVLVAKAWNVQQRDNIGHAAPSDPPAGFDYELWRGPAPAVPFQANRHHYNWHWWYDFGTGDTGNDGSHELDIARWGLGVQTHPTSISAVGGKYFFDDDQQFPDTQYVQFQYADGAGAGTPRQLTFEMRLWSRYGLEGVDNGNAFYGTEGWMLLSKRGVVKAFDNSKQPIPIEAVPQNKVKHLEDFIGAIREQRQPNAPIQVGHLSASLCHLANISTRVGRSVKFDPAEEQILGDDEANLLLRRTYADGHWAVPQGV